MIQSSDVVAAITKKFKDVSDDAAGAAELHTLLVVKTVEAIIEVLNHELEARDARIHQLESKLSIENDL